MRRRSEKEHRNQDGDERLSLTVSVVNDSHRARRRTRSPLLTRRSRELKERNKSRSRSRSRSKSHSRRRRRHRSRSSRRSSRMSESHSRRSHKRSRSRSRSRSRNRVSYSRSYRREKGHSRSSSKEESASSAHRGHPPVLISSTSPIIPVARLPQVNLVPESAFDRLQALRLQALKSVVMKKPSKRDADACSMPEVQQLPKKALVSNIKETVVAKNEIEAKLPVVSASAAWMEHDEDDVEPAAEILSLFR